VGDFKVAQARSSPNSGASRFQISLQRRPYIISGLPTMRNLVSCWAAKEFLVNDQEQLTESGHVRLIQKAMINTKRIFAGVILAALLACPAVAQLPNRVNLKLDASEAEAVLTILDKRAHHEDVTDADWQKLFGTTPYRRLKQRETSMRRPFTDEEFTNFVTALDARREQLRQTLRQWQSADLQAVAQRPLRYLPPEASIHADVYPVIKPQSNSFVFEAATAPTIFLYLDPKMSRAQFENTVAHESHHIGLASLDAAYEERIKSLPEDAREAARWMGAFGEGMAVLAAAGSPDVPPMADFPERDQVLWDLEAERFGANLDDLNQFFLDTVHGDLRNDAVAHEGAIFFGYRGPWYTVGYRMAVTIERELGRPALVATLADAREFVARYNEAAVNENAKNGGHLPLFTAEILKAVGTASSPPPAH
jgi:hypothetical protein